MDAGNNGLIVFAFGAPSGIRSNQILSENAAKIAAANHWPVYTQADIVIDKSLFDVTYTAELPGEPPPTLRIARGAAEWALARELDYVFILAAAPHQSRCYRDFCHALCEIRGKSMPVIWHLMTFGSFKRVPEEEWFCHDSLQSRTRSRAAWERREWILMHMPMFIYKRVAN
ncbi:MAG: hypothetical protein PHQ47_01455 [Candidatus Portnoybacteria bacterium]|nr:hypothetical protein [Candidatus Portnoybacteria bacterium]